MVKTLLSCLRAWACAAVAIATVAASAADVSPATKGAAASQPASRPIDFAAIASPIIFKGDANTAYRDPAAVYHNGVFRVFFTLVKKDDDGGVNMYTAVSRSADLVHWTDPRILTPKDRSLNYSSPGDVIRFGNEWVLCLQTYCRPKGEKFGNASSRLFVMRSGDLETWSKPEMLMVKGPDVPADKMGRMIDPYLLEDKDEPGKWWCFYKQNGVSMSWSRDLKTWIYAGRADAGENPCVIVDGNEYVLFHSPGNGIGVKRSADFKTWKGAGLITLGQNDWPWAKGRLTAGFVLDLRRDPRVGKCIMFFHGSGPETEKTMFDNFASLGIAWSDDLTTWHWPGEKQQSEK